ncbi:MAG: SdrD B-like domain-containing protein, partial [Thiothrix litoralis]|uniref:SdrD B-like domain-containing protein n=1 Tax=Thiothrix litoralis TaxID=2891210 RepID=UPI003C712654
MPESRVANGSVGFALQILFVLLFLTALTGQALAANCTATYTNTSSGGSTNYTLNAGQSLKIASGTYTGTINNFSSTSTICVETGATFTPGNLNNPAGTLANYGTTTLSGAAFNTGTVIHNYGTFTFTGNPNTNGATTFYNHTNATMSVPTFQLGNNSTFTNDGLVTATGDLNTTTGTTLTNNYRIEVDGNFNPDGTFTNNGRAYAKNFINMNSSATIINNCTLVSYNGFNSNNPNVTNNGTILITKPNNKWQHNGSGKFRNGPNAKVAGYDFINNATVTGSGAMIFSGSTTNQGAFTGNSSTDKINFYDETQTGSQFFDFQNTVPTNTVRTAFTRPTELDTPTACSTDYKSFALAGTTGTITGTVYTDSNGNSSYDSGTESGIGFITVSVYDEKFTPTDTADDTLITTTSTSANGSYSFSGLDSGLTYRIQVETNLPSGATIGTTNPLSGKVVTAGGTLTNQNFGFNPPTSCNTGNGDFGGTVFRDYDGDGTQNLLETGLGGVTVTAYSNTNSAVSTATTANNGVYKLTGLTVGSQYRLEFTNLPSYTEPGIHSATSATSVRFITVSASCDNHFAVQSPAEYCQANPHIAVPTYTYGDSSASKVGSKPGIYTFPYSATGDASNRTSNPTQKTTIGQTGATWGTAYQASTKTLYTAAVMRRFVGFGTLSTGGIYKLDMSNPAAASTGATNYIDVRTLGIPTGDDVRDSTTCNKLATTTSSPSHDIAAWDAVGKVGIGDIDYDDTSRTLWLVNLNDRKLYGIRNISPTTPPVAADVAGGYAINLPAPYTCTSGTFRPWAVKYYRGQVYVGGVCDASSAPVTANLKGYVLKFDPANTAAGFSYVKDIPLGYNHPIDLNNPVGAWKGWISAAEAVAAGAPTNSAQHSPIISNLEFDTDGSIIVGIIDRAAMQNGDNAQNVPSCTNTSTSNPDLTGDILRLCKTDTGYISDSEPGCKTDIPANIKMQDEYYWGDYGIYPNLAGDLREIATGGLALVPGTGEVVSTTYDDSAWLTNEIMWLNNQTGAANDRYYLGTNLMGKAAGMGDIEVLCDPAPTEVGNRVWLDTNKDGIQDAGEAGINNVTVTLACGTDTATATTNTAGEYYFSNKTGGNATFMDAGESCTLKVNGSQTSLSSYTLTTQNADSKTDNNRYTDIRDSDAANNAGTAEIAFTVGSSGQNNHGLDFGYQAAATTPTVAKDYGDIPDSYHTKQSNNGASHTIVANFSLGATVDGETDGQPTAAADGDGADEDGVHFITPLLPGESALIAVGTTQTNVATAYLNGWIDFNHDGDFADANEHIITDQTIASVYTTLALLANIPADAIPGDTYARFRLSSASGTSYDGAATDGEVEDYKVTITAPSRVGDTVWLDTNQNGIQDAGEAGVQGVTVKLYRKSDNRLLGAKLTDSAGNYFFANELAAGTYYLEFTKPAGYQFTPQDAGTDPALNSDADPTTGRTGDITVVAGIPQTQWDAGLIANALVVTQCQAIPFSTTQVDHNFSVPKFDGALGTLTGVQVNAYSGIKQIWALENRSTSAASFKITSTMPASFTLPNASNLALDYSYNSGIFSIPAFDGVSDYVGTSGKSLDAWRYEGSAVSNNYTPTADFVAANAGESVTLPYSSGEGSMSLVGGGGNALFTIRTQASAGVCVNYTYTPPPPPSLGCSVLDNFDSTSVETIDLTSSSQGSVTQTWNANVDTLIGGARTLTFGPAPRGTATNGYGLLDIANNAGTAANMKLCYNANGAGLNVNVSQIENILLNVSEDEHHNPDAATRANIPMTITLSDGFNSASLT